MKTTLLVLFLGFLLTGCTKAPTVNSPNANTTEPPAIRSVDVVKAKPQEVTLSPGQSGDALINLEISNGYHVNANPPTFAYLKATELEITPAGGISVEFMTYPDALTRKFPFAEKPLAVYEGQTVLKARLKVDKTVKPGTHNLSAKLRVQACDESVCYAPGTADVTVPVNVK